MSSEGDKQPVPEKSVTAMLVSAPTPPGYHLRVGSEKARQPTTLAAAEAPGRTAGRPADHRHVVRDEG
jgi:hypothetical protein